MTDKKFNRGATVILLLLVLWTLFPLLLMVMSSLTEEATLLRNGYSIFPEKLSLSAYGYIIQQSDTILRSYGVTIIVTLIGTAVSVLLTCLLAYPMARKAFKYRGLLTFFVFFTMLFNGGIVPSYMLWTNLFHIKNTLAALIVPSYLVSAMNVILVKNYYQNNVPEALIEAAQIDGATELRIFWKIMLPLAKPVAVTIALFTGLLYWNDWTNGLYYIDTPRLYSIQLFLKKIMDNIDTLKTASALTNTSTGAASSIPGASIRMAIAVIGMLPVLIIYPFMQKYLIKGVVVGAVKG